MTHLSLFSGIGGLDLAAEMAGFQTVGQCEIEDYPYKVLCKHWPNVPKWRNIRDVTDKSFRKRTGIEQPTVISGGFPCQPHSVAGKRKASDDERDLWGEFARVVYEIKPRWVVGENVLGLLTSESGRFFGGILRDLAEMGYSVGWCSLRASWVGAVHRRERIFIIAYSDKKRLQRWLPEKEYKKTNEQSQGIYLHPLRQANEKYLSESAILRRNNGIPFRVDRTKCLGNTIVPQQAYPIFESIAEIEQGVCNLNERNNPSIPL